MIEREYIKQIMIMLNREFDINFSNKDIEDIKKINMWYEVLKFYPRHILDQAVIDLVATHEYKEVRCAHLNLACIKAIEAPAIQFGNRLVDIIDIYKSEYRIKPVIEEEFSGLGLKIYEANKDNLLFYETSQREILVKSMSEIYRKKLWIDFNSQKLIEDTKKGILLNE